METTKNTVEANKVSTATKTEGTKEVVKRAPSALYTIKSFNDYVTKVETLKLLNKEDVEILKQLGEKMVKQYMGLPLSLIHI